MHYLAFSGLKAKSHFFDYSASFHRACCNDSLSFIFDILVHSLVSSANSIILFLTHSGKSWTWMMNSNGPRTEPCGTPLSTLNQSEKFPFTRTLIALSRVRTVLSSGRPEHEHHWSVMQRPKTHFKSFFLPFLNAGQKLAPHNTHPLTWSNKNTEL